MKRKRMMPCLLTWEVESLLVLRAPISFFKKYPFSRFAVCPNTSLKHLVTPMFTHFKWWVNKITPITNEFHYHYILASKIGFWTHTKLQGGREAWQSYLLAWHRKMFCNSQIRYYWAKVCSTTYNWQPDNPQFNSLWNCARTKLWLYNLDMLNEFHLHNMDKSATSIPLIGQWQTESLTLKWTALLLGASALICGVFPGHDDLCLHKWDAPLVKIYDTHVHQALLTIRVLRRDWSCRTPLLELAKLGLQTEGIMMVLLSRADIQPTRSTLGSLQSFVCLTKVAKRFIYQRNWIWPWVRNCDGCKNSTN